LSQSNSPYRNSGQNQNSGSGSGSGRGHSGSNASSDSGRGTFSGGRDSIINTLAQRLTLSNLLTRKPAPDNTTRESFN
jgi:ribosomal protein L15